MEDNQKILKLAEELKKANRVVALTGAGISTTAGIPDFRGDKGIYTTRKVEPEKVLDIDYFLTNPDYFYRFNAEMLPIMESAQPTKGHKLLAELEKAGLLYGVITQNIDGLHQKAGTKNIIEIHGSMWRFYCSHCGKFFRYEELRDTMMQGKVPKCDSCGGVIRPDIVFFGEAVKDVEKAIEWARASDLMLVLGSTLVVYPAAYLPNYTLATGGKIVIVNQGITPFDSQAYLLFNEDIEVFSENLAKALNLSLE